MLYQTTSKREYSIKQKNKKENTILEVYNNKTKIKNVIQSSKQIRILYQITIYKNKHNIPRIKKKKCNLAQQALKCVNKALRQNIK